MNRQLTTRETKQQQQQKNPPRNTKEAKPCSGNIRPASILVIY